MTALNQRTVEESSRALRQRAAPAWRQDAEPRRPDVEDRGAVLALEEGTLWAKMGRSRQVDGQAFEVEMGRSRQANECRLTKPLHGTPQAYLSSVVGAGIVTSPNVNSWLKGRP